MSAQDASFLHVENENNPMHIGSVSQFEGPAPTYGELVRAVSAKLPLIPRYRQKVRFVPLGLGRPVWVDDPHFQILYHVRHTAVPSPGGAEQLRNLAGRIFAQRLDRSRPLWELWLVEGLSGGEWALISKVHHCMVDGVSATDLMTVLLDSSPDSQPAPAAAPWRTGHEPTGVHLVADAMADAVLMPWERLRGLPVVARSPIQQVQGALEVARMVAETALRLRRPAAASLNGSIGPHRRWSWVSVSLADVKKIRSALGGTVNDVLLAAVTRGFRALLTSRGMPVDGRVVRTLVPVSVRASSERGTYNNRVSAVFAELPIGLDDPVDRLNAVRRQMDDVKESQNAMSGEALVRLSGFAPPMLLALGARLATRFPQRSVQTVVTNVPGPQFPLYVGGRQMVLAYPYVPIYGSVRISLAIFSYVGRLSFGITADYDTGTDVEVLCRGIEEGVTELLGTASVIGSRATPRLREARRGRRRPAASGRSSRTRTGVSRRKPTPA